LSLYLAIAKILAPADDYAGQAAAARKSRMARVSCCALGVLYASPFLAILIWSCSTQTRGSILMLVFTAIVVTMLLAACARTWRRFFLLSFPFWLLATAYASYAILYDKVPGRAVALLLSGASWEEISGLFGLWQQKWLTLPIAAVLALYVILSANLPVWPIFSRKVTAAVRLALLLTVPMVVYATQSPALTAGVALNPVIGSLMFFGMQLPRAHGELKGSLVVKTPFHAHRTGSGEEVHVLIVGESARRASWSAYGYARVTTPYLDQLKKGGEAIFLRDAMSDANLTLLAVPMILTGIRPQELAAQQRLGGTLLDLAKEAGYTTSWLVNQDVGVSTLLGISADHLEYPPDLREGLFGRRALDETLLPAYRREIARTGQARLIGMHVMGSHWEYYLRYPKNLQRFGSPQRLSMLTSATTSRSMVADLMDAYDNSVLYTDWFLQQVIEQARTLQVPATVTFIPDHGEASPNLDGGAVGHGAAHYVPAEFEIPALIWVNAAYRKAHPEKVAALEANASKEIRSHDVFYTVADLMGITWPGAAPEKSFASERFVPDTTKQHLARGVLITRP
jgi:glucan phosphoethanolaminetransferase (alkaline phosphatase superfamily)